MSHIFISYSTKNADYAQKLAAKLREEGFDVWIDNEKLRASQDWWKSIVLAIRECAAFVVILTPDSDASDWVQDEITLARKYKKQRFPVWLDGDVNTPNWEIFVRVQIEDVRSERFPRPEFFAALANYATRHLDEGENITESFTPISDEAVKELAEEITPPPTPTESPPIAPPPLLLPEIQPETTPVPQAITVEPPSINPSQLPSKPRKNKRNPLRFVIAAASIGLLTLVSLLLMVIIFTPPPSILPTLMTTHVVPISTATPVTANNQWTPIIQFFSGVEMVMVPQGCFKMGSLGGYSDETPVENICFDQPFWIDRYEVTNAQYGSSGNFAGDNLPREGITWFEAKVFCEARGARLPTEAEWEYAARGPSNFSYPWGYLFFTDYAVYSRNRNSQTAPVGSKPMGASWVGALDMSGNVWEWVSTIYDEKKFPYPYKPDDGRENMDDRTSFRVMRGGSWFDSFGFLRSANRHSNSPDQKSSLTGFRCARDYQDGDLAN